METQLPKDKLKKSMERVAKTLENKISTTHKEQESLVGILSFTAEVVCQGRAFLRLLYNGLDKSEKYLHLSKHIEDDLLWWENFLLR